MSERLQVYYDMDDTIAQCVPEVLLRYNKEFGQSEPIENVQHGLGNLTMAPAGWLDGLFRNPNFFEDLLPIEGAIEGMREVAEFADVSIATIAYTSAAAGKLRWVDRYVPFVRQAIVLATPESSKGLAFDKSMVGGRAPGETMPVLVSDSIHDLCTFRGLPICFGDYPWNQVWKRAPRFCDHASVVEFLRCVNENKEEFRL